MEINPKYIERFWSKVKKGTDDECWIWLKSCDTEGYGRFQMEKKRYGAHRFVWLITHGNLPDELDVLHNCPTGDNKKCVNPRHLWLGTQDDNMKDARDKGQLKPCKGEDHYSYLHPEKIVRGEDHYQHKNPELRRYKEKHARYRTDIDDDKVKEFYDIGWTQKEIAEHFFCNQGLISNIILNKRLRKPPCP